MTFEKLSQQDISKAVGVTPKTVRRWTEAGLPRNKDGTYSLPKVIEWLLNREREEGSPEDKESLQWLGLYRKERYLLAKLEREQTEGSLISRAEVARQWAWRIGEVKSGLLALANRLSPLVVGKDHKDAHKLIYGECWALLDNYCRNGRFTPCLSKNRNKEGNENNEEQKTKSTAGD